MEYLIAAQHRFLRVNLLYLFFCESDCKLIFFSSGRLLGKDLSTQICGVEKQRVSKQKSGQRRVGVTALRIFKFVLSIPTSPTL